MLQVMQATEAHWTRAKERLRVLVGENVYSSWFARMQFESTKGNTVELSVPTGFLKSWINDHYSGKLLECMQSEISTIEAVKITVRSVVIRTKITDKPPAAVPVPRGPQSLIGALAVPRGPIAIANNSLGGSPLDPRLTLGSFMVGRSNTLVQAAVTQASQACVGDTPLFNPLYIHSGVGLGKTHLLQAIVWAAKPERKVLYLTAERFMYGFLSAVRSHSTLAFKDVLRTIDTLIIDDLQFLQGNATQSEFCHVINTLVDAGRQVVIAADRPPGDLENLDERVRSRLTSGLVLEIGAHDEELRLEILKSRVAAAKHHYPGFDVPLQVLSFIAKIVMSNGRDLEGAINRLLAKNTMNGQIITLEMAEREVRDLVRPQEPRRVKIEEIQRIVARQYNVSRADLLSSRRTANVVRPRQVAMYLAKTLTLRSLPEIGRRFGGRDHTTVLHAVRKIEHLVGADNALAEEVENLKRQLQE